MPAALSVRGARQYHVAAAFTVANGSHGVKRRRRPMKPV
jgi:hypothetical protein